MTQEDLNQLAKKEVEDLPYLVTNVDVMNGVDLYEAGFKKALELVLNELAEQDLNTAHTELVSKFFFLL